MKPSHAVKKGCGRYCDEGVAIYQVLSIGLGWILNDAENVDQ